VTFPQPVPEPVDVVPDSPNGVTPSRRHQVQIIATIAVVVAAVIAIVVSVVGGPSGTRVSNAKLLRLIHASANSINRAPSTTIHMTMDISAEGHHGQMQMNGIESRPNHESTLSITGLGQSLRVLTIGGVVYETVSAAGQSANNNKPWIALHSPTPTPQLKALQDQGPAAYLKVLANVDGRIYDEGKQTVKGVSATKYSFRVNFLSLLGPTFRNLYPQLTDERLKQTGLDNLPMSVWLDRSGLTREMQVSFKYAAVSLNETMYLEPSQLIAHLTAPPPSETNTVSSLQDLERVLSATIGTSAG